MEPVAKKRFVKKNLKKYSAMDATKKKELCRKHTQNYQSMDPGLQRRKNFFLKADKITWQNCQPLMLQRRKNNFANADKITNESMDTTKKKQFLNRLVKEHQTMDVSLNGGILDQPSQNVFE